MLRNSRYLFVAVVLTLTVSACGASKQPSQTRRSFSVPKPSAYVGMLAAVHYCACGRWPGSWSELREFDRFLHEIVDDEGRAAGPTHEFAWDAFADSTVREDADGRFLAVLRSGDPVSAGEMMVPIPDCSNFRPGAYDAGCRP